MDLQSLELCIIATVIVNSANNKCVVKYVQLPLKIVAEIENANKEAEHKVTLVINQKPIPLMNMFSGKWLIQHCR